MPKFAFLFMFLGLMACSVDTSAPPDDDRGPVSKADLVGSCAGFCGGQADGNCWCDDACQDFGDCCSDYAPECTALCPEIVMPPPTFCPDGDVVPVVSDQGCTVSFDCVVCPEIVMPPPTFCPDGDVVPVESDQGCTVGFDCVVCPEIVMPPPTFCPDGDVVPVESDQGCTVGFDCQ